MPARIEGFVPARLTMAREARELLQRELAEAIGRSPATLSKWEAVDSPQAPDASVIPLLAAALSVEPSWFFKSFKSDANAAFARSLKSSLARTRQRTISKLLFVEEIESYLSEYVDFPEVDVPDVLNGRSFVDLRHADIEGCALALRDHWSLGLEPIEDVLLIMENAGIVIGVDQIGSLKLDGLSKWSSRGLRPYTLLAQDKFVGARRRFDAAHELAHIVLHRHVRSQELVNHFDLIEEQAMAFAGAFLLPAGAFTDDVFSLSLDAIASLKPKWKVSVAAMIKRLSTLDIVSAQYSRRLWQYYSSRRWRSGEPFDDLIEIEQPQLLSSALEALIKDYGVSSVRMAQEIGLPVEEMLSLAAANDELAEFGLPNVTRLQPEIRSDRIVKKGEFTGVVDISTKRPK